MVHSSRDAAKSPQSEAHLILQAAMHLTSKSNNVPFEIIAGVGIGPACFP